MAYPSGIFTLVAAFLGTGLVIVGTQIDVRVATAARRRIVVLGAGLALWIAVAMGTLEGEIVLYQVALIAVLASIVWVLTRRAEDAGVRMYAQAFPFDQTACPGSTNEPRAYLGGAGDQARRCESGAAPAVVSSVRQPSKPN
ncbi:MAG TPA: hypothetical protein VJO99_11400 [Burkholderiaceae bacterium]|nr:hypothetical protein [Burkholderiaceae bacterium]